MKKSILEVVHESAKDLFEIGLMDETTMRSFDTKCSKHLGANRTIHQELLLIDINNY